MKEAHVMFNHKAIRLAGVAGATIAVATGLVLLTQTSAMASVPGATNRPAVTAQMHARSSVDDATLQPAFVGNTYTGQVGPGTYSPQFCGPISTPTNPNPPTQFVHITAGSSGATVALSLSVGNPDWSVPWVLGPGASVVIPVQNMEMVGIANTASGAPGSFTVTSITAS
jgi:hypothetical protein